MLEASEFALKSGFLKAYMALLVTTGLVAWFQALLGCILAQNEGSAGMSCY